MLKKFQKFPLLQTSESVLSFMNGSTLVHLVVWIFMLWFIDIFSYHHLRLQHIIMHVCKLMHIYKGWIFSSYT